jgi:hypothetical protein
MKRSGDEVAGPEKVQRVDTSAMHQVWFALVQDDAACGGDEDENKSILVAVDDALYGVLRKLPRIDNVHISDLMTVADSVARVIWDVEFDADGWDPEDPPSQPEERVWKKTVVVTSEERVLTGLTQENVTCLETCERCDNTTHVDADLTFVWRVFMD